MSTSMHRLQISLPQSQAKYLSERARLEGISIAELIRRLISHETRITSRHSIDSIWEIIGIGKSEKPLIENIPVSEQPDLYIADPSATYSKASSKKRNKAGGKKR